ncbi:23S rRNA (guanosine(2251)-2'-O)-methyltransferase RlmB [Magnetospira sp. QH-2]|uniref:23S rRNA (guanosine(2251)-2'-O)-methyltransferase RlmB n=1 Tax=Magnetospira sp. (strain QH-2) TaxID=1288970 RepID=UPI0003E80CBD|nr:23S rRNA (guanosine(2251)-2'-O)-methyltransferase RlmB [Magnetospira sp. QH-2]CCQ74625.1 23S rRNA (guanosine-2'-O-)-methyltransferase RlmB [Magnetospira sp. QH-2]
MAGDATWIWGTHPVQAAWTNPDRRLLRLIGTSEALKTLTSLPDRPHPESLTRGEITQVLPEGALHQGLAALIRPLPERFVEDLAGDCADDSQALVVVLDRANDPHNIGAVLRSAAAFGARALILPRHHAPDVTGVMAKAACGALERVPLIQVPNISRALGTLKESGFWCVGLDGRADSDLPTLDLNGRTALVMGSEGDGLRRLTRETCDLLARIPMTSAVESLNLSNAAAIALYEIARRRTA